MPRNEKSIPREKSGKGVSRRDFIKLAGLSAAAGAAMADPLATKGLAAPAGIDGGAEKIYHCKDSLNRFAVKNFAFKKVSEEMGEPWMKPWLGNMLKNAKNSKIGSQVPVKDPKEARAHIALWVASATWNRLSGPYGDGLENQGFLSWKPLGVPPMLLGNPDPNPDAKDLTKKIKQIARFVGANMVGVAKLNRKWVYDEACRNAYMQDAPVTKKIVFKEAPAPDETDAELIVPESVKYAIVTVIDLNRLATQIGPASLATSSATNMGYSRMGITDIALAEAIRAMGYNAIPAKNGVGLSVPLAIDAGLGQLGRNGLLVTEKYGPAIRIGKVLTDMPLVPDRPVDFGVTKFCESCKKCAAECPPKAIAMGERTYDPPGDTGNPGALKWYVDGRKCLRYWVEAGASCAGCQAVCPYTKGSFWGHGVVRSMIGNASPLDFLWEPLDTLFGYGGRRNPDAIWQTKFSPFGIDPTKV